MSDLWFTSDQHFGHGNIIEFCDRPFRTLDGMNEFLRLAWNEVVKPDDTVVHVGDVAMGRTEDVAPVLSALNGRKLVLLGNHDLNFRQRLYADLGWHMLDRLVVDSVCMQHRYIVGAHPYTAVIHGHAHGSQMLLPRHHDVGVDVGNWQGVSRWGKPVPASAILGPLEVVALQRALGGVFG